MTDKVVLTDLANLQNETTAINAINANNAAITTAMNNTLSRDGTATNSMSDSLDMDSNRIINLLAPIGNTEPVRLGDLTTFAAGGTVNAIPSGGTTGQALVKASNTNYDVIWSASTITGTNSVIGVLKCDGVTTNCVAGAIVAIGGVATALSEGVTTITSGHSPEFLLNISGTLQGSALSAGGSPLLNFSASTAPSLFGGDNGIQITGTSGAFPTIHFDAFQGGGTAANGKLVFTVANGTNAAPTAVLDTQNIGGFKFYAYAGGAYTLAATLNCAATDNFSAAYTPTRCSLNNAGFSLGGNQKSKAWTVSGIQWTSASATLTDTTSSGTVLGVFDNYAGLAENTTTSATTYTHLYGWYFDLPFCSGNLTCTNIWAVGGKNARFGQFSDPNAVTISSTGLVTVPLGGMTVGSRATIGQVSYGDFISNSSNVAVGSIPVHYGSGNIIVDAYWNGAPTMQLVGYGGGPETGIIVLGGAGGSVLGPGASAVGNLLGQIFYDGFNSSAWAIGGFEQMVPLETWTTIANGTQWELYVVPVGATYLSTGAAGYIMFADWTNGVRIFSGLQVDLGLQVGAPTGGYKGTGTVNARGAYYQNNTIGVTCAGSPTVAFASTLGIVTHC